MSEELLEKLLPSLKDTLNMHSFGWGEPLVFPNYMDLIARLRRLSSRMHISFNTNGLLLTPRITTEVLDAKVNEIVLSIDSVNKEGYEAIRIGAEFEILCKNIEELNSMKARRRTDLPRLGLEVVVMNQNIDELVQIVEFARHNGFGRIALEQVQGRPDLMVSDYRPYQELFRQALKIAKGYGIPLVGPFVDRQHQLFYPARNGVLPIENWVFKYPRDSVLRRRLASEKPTQIPRLQSMMCLQPWHTVYVRCNGEVLTCCIGSPILGNLKDKTFEEVWNGKPYQDLRRSIATGDYREDCEACIRQRRVPGNIPLGWALPGKAWNVFRRGGWDALRREVKSYLRLQLSG